VGARAGIALGLWAGLSLIGFEGLLTVQESETKSSLELQIDEIVAPYVAARDFMGVVAVQPGNEAAVFGEPYSVPTQRRYSDLQDVSIDDLVGIYSFGPALSVTLIESDERLLACANKGGYSELIPVSETEWFSRLLCTTVRFGRDDKGSIDRLLWGPGDQPLHSPTPRTTDKTIPAPLLDELRLRGSSLFCGIRCQDGKETRPLSSWLRISAAAVGRPSRKPWADSQSALRRN